MRHLSLSLLFITAACAAPTSSGGGGGGGRGGSRADAGPAADAGNNADAGIEDPTCGDGNVDEGETCDDGNTTPGDGCDAQCQTEGGGGDDHGNDIGNATRAQLDAPRPGIIEVEGDVDVFTFTIAVEGDYIATVSSEGVTLGCLLADAEGQPLQENQGDDECVVGSTLAPGVYFVAVRLVDGTEPVRYTVLITEGEAPTTTCGDGIVEFPEGCDDGNNVDGDGCDANCQPELGDDQQSDTPDGAATLNIDQVVESAINTGGDVDYYAFTTNAAGEYQIESTGNTDVYCHLENGAGEEIATNDDGGEGTNCLILEELEAETRYLLKVRGYSETRTGRYSISVIYLAPPVCGNGQVERGERCDDGNVADGDGCSATCTVEDDFGNSADEAHGIADPSETAASLIEADEDFFSFTAAATGDRQIHTSGETDTFCHLLDADGNELASNDDGDEGLNCRIVHALTAGTTYVIRVRGFSEGSTGDYRLHLGPVVAP